MANETIPEDDLISLEGIKGFFLSIFKVIFKGIDLLLGVFRKNILLFLILPLLGLGLAFLYYNFKPRVYEETMIVKFNELTKSTYFEIFSQLNDLASSKSYKSLAAELKVKPEIAKQIKSIKLESLNNTLPEKDTSKSLDQPFKIILDTYGNEYIDSLQNALIASINNNQYLFKIKEDQKQIYLDKLVFINKELQKLDSLKDQYTKSLNSGKLTATFYNNAFNPTEAYVHSNSLVNEKEVIQKWLSESSRPINLIDGFKKPNVSKSLGLIRILLTGILIGFLLSLVISLLREIKNLV